MNFFRKNFSLKVLALLGAIVMWVYVVGTSDLIYRVPEEISVEFFNLSEDLVVVSEQSIKVKVAVKAPKKSWKTITNENLEAYVDVKGLAPGQEHRLDVIVSSDSATVSVYEVEPKKVSVTLDSLGEKDFPITLKIEGDVSDQFEVGEPSLSQTNVVISGSQNIIDNILEIRAPIELSANETDEVKRSVALVAVDQEENVVESIVLDPSTIDVVIPIDEIVQSKSFGIKANYDPNQLDEDVSIKSVTIVPLSVELLGDASVLENLEIITTDPIDLTDIRTDIERRAALNIPSGLTLADPLNPFVTVKFEITDEQSTRKLEIPIVVDNIPVELSAMEISPAVIEIEISAQKSVLSDLDEQEISIHIDGSSLEEGEHTFTLTSDNISIPNNVDLVDFNSIEVTLILSNS